MKGRLRVTLLALVVCLYAPPVGVAQETGGPAPSAGSLQKLDAAGFLALAASLAMFELEAGSYALQKLSRPELVTLARATVDLQGEVMQRLRGAAQERNLQLPAAMSLEHRAVLDGLAPLDGEEFSRRYAEAQVQALRQGQELYQVAAGQDSDPQLKQLAGEVLPRLEQQAEMARRLVRPG